MRGSAVRRVFRAVGGGQSDLVTIMNGPPDLGVDLLGIEAGAAPRLRVGLRRPDGGTVQCVLFTATVTIATSRRGYADAERDRLAEAFGARPPDGLAWARVGATVPTFRGATEVAIALPFGPGMPAAAGRYLGALRDGDVPLDLAFDGTVFYPGDGGAPRTGQLPWRHEAAALLPVRDFEFARREERR